MPRIMADNDVGGEFQALVLYLQHGAWKEIWDGLEIKVENFETLAMSRTVSDAVIWQTCQDKQIILVTGNRNDDGPDSLESTIRLHNTGTCLPVFTLADPARIMQERMYAERTGDRLIEYLFEIDKHLGVGRIWLP